MNINRAPKSLEEDPFNVSLKLENDGLAALSDKEKQALKSGVARDRVLKGNVIRALVKHAPTKDETMNGDVFQIMARVFSEAEQLGIKRKEVSEKLEKFDQ